MSPSKNATKDTDTAPSPAVGADFSTQAVKVFYRVKKRQKLQFGKEIVHFSGGELLSQAQADSIPQYLLNRLVNFGYLIKEVATVK